jgi:hypothetical protein
MMRECARCRRPFTAADFVKEESKNMEADRKALGLEGVRFLYYACPDCGQNEIFLDILRRDGESEENFRTRRSELEAAVEQVHADRDRVQVVLQERR